jgi:putative transposase
MRYPTMFALLLDLLAALRSAFRTRAELALENLALRQQLATLSRTAPRPRLHRLNRAFWVALSQIWHRWADALVLVRPDTVVGAWGIV